MIVDVVDRHEEVVGLLGWRKPFAARAWEHPFPIWPTHLSRLQTLQTYTKVSWCIFDVNPKLNVDPCATTIDISLALSVLNDTINSEYALFRQKDPKNQSTSSGRHLSIQS